MIVQSFILIHIVNCSMYNTCKCSCCFRVKRLLSQLIELYPDIFELVNSQGVVQEAISLCQIASITITS